MMPVRLSLCLMFDDIFKGKYKLKRMGCYIAASDKLQYITLLFEALEKLVAIESLHVLTTCTNIKFS